MKLAGLATLRYSRAVVVTPPVFLTVNAVVAEPDDVGSAKEDGAVEAGRKLAERASMLSI